MQHSCSGGINFFKIFRISLKRRLNDRKTQDFQKFAIFQFYTQALDEMPHIHCLKCNIILAYRIQKTQYNNNAESISTSKNAII